jgi:hypothetical protein
MRRYSGGVAPRGPATSSSPVPAFHARFPFHLAFLATAGLVAGLTAQPCFASLGRAPSALPAATSAHQARTLAATGATAAAGYTVDTTVLETGTTVREYVGKNGVVFAVTWNGPFLPDLRELLGQHFTTLTNESARHPKAGRNWVRAANPDVTIESTGHMRAYTGRAWVRSLLPAGFDTDTLE